MIPPSFRCSFVCVLTILILRRSCVMPFAGRYWVCTGMITINALTAADSVIIPVQTQYLPAKGMTQLLRSINMVRTHTNEHLKIGGIVMTLVDGRTNLAKEVISTIRTNYGMSIRIFDTQIPVAVKAAEAAKEGKSIFSYDAGSRPALAYEKLTKEVMKDAERERKHNKAAVAR